MQESENCVGVASTSEKVSNWDEYEGQLVCIQLKRPYFVITSPGKPVPIEYPDGSSGYLNVSVVSGIFSVKKDDYGSVRVTLLMKDPDANKQTGIRAEFDPELFAVVSVTPLAEPQSRIVGVN